MIVRCHRVIVVAAMLALAACSGGAASAPFSQAVTAPHLVPAASAHRPSAGALAAIVLYRDVFASFGNESTTVTVENGAGNAITGATWTLSNASVAFATPNPNDETLPTAPPNGVAIVGEAPGSAILTARIGNASAAVLPVSFYASTDLGCSIRAGVGQNFDPLPNPAATFGPGALDLYATGPASTDPVDPCNGRFADATETASTLHAPYGATLVTDGNDPSLPVPSGVRRTPAFPFVSGSSWRNDFTSIAFSSIESLTYPCGIATACDVNAAGVLPPRSSDPTKSATSPEIFRFDRT